jgi:hypothetical protein
MENFKDKIIHVIVDDLKCPLNYKEIWDNEHYQRNCIDKGIQRLNLKDDKRIFWYRQRCKQRRSH